MDDLVSESCRNRESTAIDQGARSGSHESTRMANRAADAIEQRIAAGCGCRYWLLTTWRTRGGHEVSESQYVESIIFRILDRIERRWEGYIDYTFSRGGGILMRS